MRQRVNSLLFIEMEGDIYGHCSCDAVHDHCAKMYLVSRTETIAKLFFIISFTGLFMYTVLAFYYFHTAYSASQSLTYRENLEKFQNLILHSNEKDLKYILIWKPRNKEINTVGEGQFPFIENNCTYINCYLITNKTILNGDYSNFDAIILNMSIIGTWNKKNLPKKRSTQQIYIFHGMVSSEDHPLCSKHLDGFFNWTWSYKITSNIFTPFIEVSEIGGKVVAPKAEVVWTLDREGHQSATGNNAFKTTTLGNNSIDEINIKNKALAWVMKDCDTNWHNMLLIKQLQVAMKQHDLVFDIYGCENLKCPEGNCLKAIENYYYFYLAFEDGISEDYVTDEVLKAYHHDAIPIVVGGAEYSRFLPPNSYIDSRIYTPGQLAALIYYIISNPSVYREYFHWKSYYTISAVNPNRGFCDICNLLNDQYKNNVKSSYENFRKWWHRGHLKDRCFPKGAERYEEVYSYVNDRRTNKIIEKQ